MRFTHFALLALSAIVGVSATPADYGVRWSLQSKDCYINEIARIMETMATIKTIQARLPVQHQLQRLQPPLQPQLQLLIPPPLHLQPQLVTEITVVR
jgi:hypothetical protein